MVDEGLNRPSSVVIIGGGLAGLTAALILAERGLAPLVLEADQAWAGGRLSGGDDETFDYQGRTWSFPTEHGIHALWGGYVNMRAMLERFTDLALTPSADEMWINRHGRDVSRTEAGAAVRSRWLPAPFHYLQLLLRPRFWSSITPLDFLSLPGFLVSILLTVGWDPLREGRALDGLTMDEYFRGWTPRLKATFVGLGKNLLAASDANVSLSAFVAAIRFYTMLNRTAWHPHFLPGDSHSALIAPLIARLEALGGRILYGTTAERLERFGHGWRVHLYDASRRGQRTAAAEHVVLAVNAPAAQRLLCASQDACDGAAALTIPGGLQTTTVRLWFRAAPARTHASGMLTGDFHFDNFFWLDQLQPPFAAWRAETGGSVIELHLYATERVNNQPDALLLTRALDDVQLAFPELRGAFVHGAVRRNSKTHTQFRVPTAASLHVRTPWPALYACGDWVGCDTPSLWMERACTTGIAAANEILVTLGCAPFPVLQPAAPEPLARAMGAFVGAGRRHLGGAVGRLFRAGRARASRQSD